MDAKTKVTLFDLNDQKVDEVEWPFNPVAEPGSLLIYQGRRFARGGGPDSFYGPNEYGEIGDK